MSIKCSSMFILGFLNRLEDMWALADAAEVRSGPDESCRARKWVPERLSRIGAATPVAGRLPGAGGSAASP